MILQSNPKANNIGLFFVTKGLENKLLRQLLPRRKILLKKKTFCYADCHRETDCASVRGMEEKGKSLFAEYSKSILERRIN